MPGHDATRDYLVAELTAMGLQPEIQTASAAVLFDGSEAFSTGMISNVLVRIPGTANTGAIAINAHYDGGSTGPAAGDNGVGVVATLEVVRALLAGEPLANDLIVVFSDAEEHGDLGSAAFNQDHPWATDVRIAINFEAQGTGGPAMLYATSDEDGWLTGEYLSVAPEPSAYSLLPELVRALPGFRLACDLEDYLVARRGRARVRDRRQHVRLPHGDRHRRQRRPRQRPAGGRQHPGRGPPLRAAGPDRRARRRPTGSTSPILPGVVDPLRRRLGRSRWRRW